MLKNKNKEKYSIHFGHVMFEQGAQKALLVVSD